MYTPSLGGQQQSQSAIRPTANDYQFLSASVRETPFTGIGRERETEMTSRGQRTQRVDSREKKGNEPLGPSELPLISPQCPNCLQYPSAAASSPLPQLIAPSAALSAYLSMSHYSSRRDCQRRQRWTPGHCTFTQTQFISTFASF